MREAVTGPPTPPVAGLGHPGRPRLLSRALFLAWFTVAWNLVEGVVAVTAGILAGSVALVGFGLDSFVEATSGGVIVWRTVAERRATGHEAVEAIERRAGKLVAASLLLLAAYISWDAATSIYRHEKPDVSVVGLVLAVLSMAVMRWLARAKRRTAAALGSRAMQADAFQTAACFWLSVLLLAGVGLNALWGWWWADPLAALAMVWPLGVEAREAWKGEMDGG